MLQFNNSYIFVRKNLRRISQQQLKTFGAILIFGSLGFLTVEYANKDLNTVADNFGIDCSEVRRYKKAGLYEESRRRFKDVIVHYKIINLKDEEHNIDLRPFLNCLDADDPYLAHVIENEMLLPPAPNNSEYNLKNPGRKEIVNNHQALDIMEMVYKNKLKNGFFVEAGAADCEFSVSLPLEANYGWTGILVEAVPGFFKHCKKVLEHRITLHVDVTLDSLDDHLKLKENPALTCSGTLDEKKKTRAMAGFNSNSKSKKDVYTIQCFPLESILSALYNPVVNLFVLDVEGFEFAILRAIDWSKVNIEVLSVEVDIAGVLMKDSSVEIIRDFMKSKGYQRFTHRNDFNPSTGKNLNDLYVRHDIVELYDVVQLPDKSTVDDPYLDGSFYDVV